MRTLVLALTSVFAVSCNQQQNGAGDKLVAIAPPALISDPGKQPPKDNGDAGGVDLNLQASKILKENCASCHDGKTKSGNFGSVENVEEMISSKRFIVAGDADKSLIYQRMKVNMPPGKLVDSKSMEVMKKWIEGLKEPSRETVTLEAMYKLIEKDLEKPELQSKAAREGLRYFTLHVPYNQGVTSTNVEVFRKAFAKVLNSVSFASRIVKPRAIDSNNLLFAVNIKDLGQKVSDFESIISDFYPFCNGDTFALAGGSQHKVFKEKLGTACYLIRADWFAATAALPEPYNRFLKQGNTRQELDEKLGINVNENLKERKVIRAGFRNSGVSSFNRMIERHDQSNGLGYWISYDFGKLEDEENLFTRPLGPIELLEGAIPEEKGDPVVFKHDGGEVIYHLPNGLFGYYLATGDGKRIDKGPTFIVRQDGAPTQFVSAIVNGVSCMNCHNAGIIKKDDDVKRLTDEMIRDEVVSFSEKQKELIAELYVPPAAMNKKMDEDNEHYFKALKELDIDREKPDPVIEAFRIYNRNLVKEDLAHELTLESNLFSQIFASKTFTRLWGALSTQGTYISRDEFQSGVALIASIKGFEEFLKEPKKGEYVVSAACMFKDQLKMDQCVITKADAEKKLKIAEKEAKAAGSSGGTSN
ncbi:MAG: hypothetical protein RLZZ488_2827 [Pseudomonadota bacterium]|jgi:serine/threonine-protein kinase